ncbi:MAG: hypothetical protein ACE5OZ_04090 [Candidatus Heimdallarchaeota archaeon]
MKMEERLQELIKNLQNASGIEIHSHIVRAFRYMGYDAEEVEDTQAEPDILVYSRSARDPYMLVIEATVVEGSDGQVGVEKVAQIRGNAPYHISLAESQEKISKGKGYLVVLGKSDFSKNAIRNSEPDVCLISVDDLINLLESYQKYQFPHEDMEAMFRNSGKASEHFERVVIKRFKDAVLTYGLICYTIEKIFKEDDAPPRPSEIIYSAKMILRLWNLPKSEKRIQEGINFLTDPVAGVFTFLDGSYRLTSRALEEYLPSRFGELGKKIFQAYSYWKRHLRKLGSGAEFT